MYHKPVMLNECLDGLNIRPDGIYVDVTFGGGGHSRGILGMLGNRGKLVAFDQDEDAKKNLPVDERLCFIDQNFEFIGNHLKYQGLLPVDGVLADLGVSSHQFDTGERGFSFRFEEAALDMRMDRSSGLSAAEVLNTYTATQLANLLFEYGELHQSRAIAQAIISAREKASIKTVSDLRAALASFAPKFKDYQFWAQVFQSLRIEVNRELEVLKSFLLQCSDVVRTNGRLVVMSYHSLEDRLVKNFMSSGSFDGEQVKDLYGNIIRPFTPVSRKAIVPGKEELELNTRSRSAKLRIAQKN
jgi:16S rRNA (cytosine1402-N4)-methyltransferase